MNTNQVLEIGTTELCERNSAGGVDCRVYATEAVPQIGSALFGLVSDMWSYLVHGPTHDINLATGLFVIVLSWHLGSRWGSKK